MYLRYYLPDTDLRASGFVLESMLTVKIRVIVVDSSTISVTHDEQDQDLQQEPSAIENAVSVNKEQIKAESQESQVDSSSELQKIIAEKDKTRIFQKFSFNQLFRQSYETLQGLVDTQIEFINAKLARGEKPPNAYIEKVD